MKNENGVYLNGETEVVATRGHSKAEVRIAQCEDGRFRFSIGFSLSIQGMGGPITDHGEGYATYAEAKNAGIAELLEQFPKPREYEADSFKSEVQDMRRKIELHLQQPSLF